jgi:uncharacterized membrane protein
MREMSSKEEKSELRQVFHQGDPKWWASLRDEDRNKILKNVSAAVSTITYQQSTSVYSGPIPSPDMLDEYNRIMPNGADRIMKMAEAQSDHRMRLESQTVTSQNKQGERGQIFALVSVIVLILAGGMATWLGQKEIAITIFGTTVLGMGGVFAYGKYAMRRNLSKKAETK